MEDVGRIPEPSGLSPVSDATSIPTLDGWIESLMACKQLSEDDVQKLCDKVRNFVPFGINQIKEWYKYSKSASNANFTRHERFCKKSQMCNQW